MLKEKLEAFKIVKGKIETDLYKLVTEDKKLFDWMMKVSFIIERKHIAKKIEEVLLTDPEIKEKYEELNFEIEKGKESVLAFFSSRENSVRKELNELVSLKLEKETFFKF